jgi:hypothetical protein
MLLVDTYGWSGEYEPLDVSTRKSLGTSVARQKRLACSGWAGRKHNRRVCRLHKTHEKLLIGCPWQHVWKTCRFFNGLKSLGDF